MNAEITTSPSIDTFAQKLNSVEITHIQSLLSCTCDGLVQWSGSFFTQYKPLAGCHNSHSTNLFTASPREDDGGFQSLGNGFLLPGGRQEFTPNAAPCN
jgi:hypothetical protein